MWRLAPPFLNHASLTGCAMFRLVGVVSAMSAVALLLGFTGAATAAAQAMVAFFSLAVIAFIASAAVMVGEALAGRNVHRFPPPG